MGVPSLREGGVKVWEKGIGRGKALSTRGEKTFFQGNLSQTLKRGGGRRGCVETAVGREKRSLQNFQGGGVSERPCDIKKKRLGGEILPGNKDPVLKKKNLQFKKRRHKSKKKGLGASQRPSN